MSLLDDLLRLLGTNRVRLRWKLQQLKEGLGRKKRSAQNAGKSLAYEHQLCPSCGHPASKDEKVCSRCQTRLVGAGVQKAGRALGMLLPEGVPAATLVFLAACVGLFLITVKATHDYSSTDGDTGFTPGNLQIIRYGANFAPLVFQEGEYWRWITSNFLHGGAIHIGLNAYNMWLTGRLIEERWGWARTVVLLFVSGVIGTAVSSQWGSGFSIGASTAAFGEIGFILAHTLRFRRGNADLRSAAIQWVLFGLIMTFAIPRIDIMGHVGGLVAGAALGVVVADKRHARKILPEGAWVAMAAACVGAVAWAFYMCSRFDLEKHL